MLHGYELVYSACIHGLLRSIRIMADVSRMPGALPVRNLVAC